MLSKFQNIWICSYTEMPKTWVYHWVVAVLLAKPSKHPFLTEISWTQSLSNSLKTVGVDR